MSETLTDPATFDEAAETAAYEAEQQEAPPAPAETAEAPPEPERAPKHVPLAVLMQEREALRQERAERQRLMQLYEQSNKRLEDFVKAVTPKPAPEPVPDINTDPVGYFQRQLAETQRELAEVKGFKQQFEQQGQQSAEEAQFINTYRMDAATFAQKAQDFPTAYDHFKQAVIRDALETGADPQEAVAEMEAKERAIVARALRTGKSPAEAVYKAAQRYGYKGAAPAANATAKMDAMQRGQQAAKSTAAPGARGRYEGLTAETLASMSQAEFDRVPPDVVRRLLGG